MPEILLMRHAESRHSAVVTRDRDRPLTSQGEAAARTVGRVISRLDAAPDHVLTSPAVRAQTTARLAADSGDWASGIEVVEGLYGGGTPEALAALAAAPSVGRLMVVGHEPTCSDMVATLVGGGRHRMIPAAVACIQMASLDSGENSLLWMLAPDRFSDVEQAFL